MSKLTRLFLVISLFFLSGCAQQNISGERLVIKTQKYTIPYFNVPQKEYSYQANIEAFDNSINGILAVKNFGEYHKRLALLSDFGNTLLDFEFQNEKVKVHYIMEDLNRKIILKKLKKYLHLLVHSNYKVKKMFKFDQESVIQSKFQGKRMFLYIDSNDRLTHLKQASVFKDKVDIYFYGQSETADSILFISHEIPINIALKKRY